MSDQLGEHEPEDPSSGDRPLSIPRAADPSRFGTRSLFPNSVHAARRRARKLVAASSTARDYWAANSSRSSRSDASVEEPRPGGSHPSVPPLTSTRCSAFAGRQPAADRPGSVAFHLAEVTVSLNPHFPHDTVMAAVPEGAVQADDRLEIDALAQHQEQLPAGRVAVAAPVRRPPDAGTNINEPGRLADFIASSLSTISTASNRSPRDAGHPRAYGQLESHPDQRS